MACPRAGHTFINSVRSSGLPTGVSQACARHPPRPGADFLENNVQNCFRQHVLSPQPLRGLFELGSGARVAARSSLGHLEYSRDLSSRPVDQTRHVWSQRTGSRWSQVTWESHAGPREPARREGGAPKEGQGSRGLGGEGCHVCCRPLSKYQPV